MTAFVHYNDLVAGTAPPAGEDTVIWVPGEFIACHRVTVPPVSGKKWRAMIPWLLEEHSLEPAEQLAFSAADKQADNRVPVVAVNRDRLDDWKREIESAGGSWTALVPDFFALPWQGETVSVGVDGERCLVRLNRWQGAAGTVEFIAQLLRARLAGTGEGVVVYHRDQRPAIPLGEGIEPEYRPVAGLWTPDHRDWISLAAGEAGKARTPWTLPARVACALAGLLLGLVTATAVVENRRIGAQAAYLQGELRRGYRQYFGQPYDFPMSDFQRVVSSRLEAASGANGVTPLSLTERLGGVLGECGGCRLQRLEISGDRLLADLTGDDIASRLAGMADGNDSLSLRQAGDHWRLSLKTGAVRDE